MSDAGATRFALSRVQKLQNGQEPATASLRLSFPEQHLMALCADPAVGLDSSVRLRAFCVDESLVSMVLRIDCPRDPASRSCLSVTSAQRTREHESERGPCTLHGQDTGIVAAGVCV